MYSTLTSLLFFFLTFLPTLLAVAYIILAERKVMAAIQRRRGPNVVGLYGLLQPIIDAVKVLSKEQIFPSRISVWLFCLGPALTLVISLSGWMFIPFAKDNFYFDFANSLLGLLAFSSIGVYGIAISGWASNSRYALLGAIRGITQYISYELVLMICLLPILLFVGTTSFIDIVEFQIESVWFVVPLWPLAYMFFVAGLAETNRTPFDLPEAEAELVAGYNVEYSAVLFVFFMLSEYNSLLLMAALFSLLFLAGWGAPVVGGLVPELIVALKIVAIATGFILVRATQPRLRFDQLLSFAWRRFIPLSFVLQYFLFHFWVFC